MEIMLHIYKHTAKNTQTNVEYYIRSVMRSIDTFPIQMPTMLINSCGNI